jgi:hypothetical protein
MSQVLFIYIGKENPIKFYNKYNLLTAFKVMVTILSELTKKGCKEKDANLMTSLIFKLVSKKSEIPFDDTLINLKNMKTNYFKVSKFILRNDLNNFLKKEIERNMTENKKGDIVTISREVFNELISIILKSFNYVKVTDSEEPKIDDFKIACDFHEKNIPIIVLLGGTSGCGKSSISSILASKLGIDKVLSTDSIRHMLRSFIKEEENPVVFASTYYAYESIKSKKTGSELVLEGYTKQCEAIFEFIEKYIQSSLEKKDSLIIEVISIFNVKHGG